MVQKVFERSWFQIMNTRSLFYFLDYLGKLVKQPLTVQVGLIEKTYLPAKQVVISPSFFKYLPCRKCGACCRKGVSLAFTASDKVAIEEYGNTKLLSGLKQYEINIGDSKKCWWLYEQSKPQTCDFLVSNLCSVHDVKAVNCLLPPILVGYCKKTQVVKLTKEKLHWRWVPNCQAQYTSFDLENFLNWDLYCLRRLQRSAEDLGIQTYLPEILEKLENWLQTCKDLSFFTGTPKDTILIV